MLWEKAVSTKPKVQNVKQVVSDARNQREEGLQAGVWGSARLWGRSWAARHTEDVRRDLRLHTIGHKEGKIHHYLDTSKDNRCTGRISKSSSLKKDDWEFTLPCSPTPWAMDASSLRIAHKCCCKVQFSILHAWPAPLHDFQVDVCLSNSCMFFTRTLSAKSY